MTMVNPKLMAKSIARTALITEAQPFTPQAHGISSGAKLFNLMMASGKGIPIQKERGAISNMVIMIFSCMGWLMNAAKM